MLAEFELSETPDPPGQAHAIKKTKKDVEEKVAKNLATSKSIATTNVTEIDVINLFDEEAEEIVIRKGRGRAFNPNALDMPMIEDFSSLTNRHCYYSS